jgi:hypothetical protein
MVVPGETLFIEQCPDESHASGNNSDPSTQHAANALSAARAPAVYCYEPQTGKLHADGIGITEAVDKTVEQSQQHERDSIEGQSLFTKGEIASHYMRRTQEHTEKDQWNCHIHCCSQHPMAGSSHTGLTLERVRNTCVTGAGCIQSHPIEGRLA